MNGGRIYKENLNTLSKDFINYIYELNFIEYLYKEELINSFDREKFLNRINKKYKNGK